MLSGAYSGGFIDDWLTVYGVNLLQWMLLYS